MELDLESLSRLRCRDSRGKFPGILSSRSVVAEMPENEVIFDNRRSDLPATEDSVSTMDGTDCRIVSGRLARLSVPVAALLILEDRSALLEMDGGRSLDAGLRLSTDRLCLTAFWLASVGDELLGSESFVFREE